MNVVIRADGGPTLGYGHLVRTGALAAKLLARGCRVTYATTTPDSVEKVCPSDCDIIELPRRDDPTAFLEAVEVEPDVTVVDSYVVDAEYQRLLRDRSPLVVISDDERRVSADVVVNGNLYARDLSYDFDGDRPEWYLGPDYVMLREEITKLTTRDPPSRETAKRAIVVLGGSDDAGLTPAAVRAFDGTDVVVDAVVGPGCSDAHEDDVRRAAADTEATVSVLRDPRDLPRRMFDADFALSTASTTVYELLSLGTPPVVFPVVDNQERIAAALEQRELATVLPRRPTERQIASGVRSTVTADESRLRRMRTGRTYVDGRGAERVCDAVVAVVRSCQ